MHNKLNSQRHGGAKQKSDNGDSDLIEDESYEFDDSKFKLIKNQGEQIIELNDI